MFQRDVLFSPRCSAWASARRRNLVLLCLCLMQPWSASAVTTTWSSTVSGNFEDPAGWQGGVVPGAGDVVILQTTSGPSITLSLNGDRATQSVIVRNATAGQSGGLSIDLNDHTWSVATAPGLGVGFSIGQPNPPVYMTLTGGGVLDVAGSILLSDLNVNGGTTVRATDGALAWANSTSRSLLVDGAGSQLLLSGDFNGNINANPTAIVSGGCCVIVRNGGRMESRNVVMPAIRGDTNIFPLPASTVELSNPGSIWDVEANFSVGNQNIVDVKDGATLDVGQALQLNASGAVAIDGGFVRASTLTSTGGKVTLTSGTFALLDGGIAVGQGGALSADTVLTDVKTLSIGGTTSLVAGSRLTLDGGRFSTGALSGPGSFVFTRGRFELTGEDFILGDSSVYGDNFALNSGRDIAVTQNVVVDAGAQLLTTGGGSLEAAQLVNHGQVVVDGFASDVEVTKVVNDGTVIGNGRLKGGLDNLAGGQVRATTGGLLQFSGATSTNAGSINALGGTVEFGGALDNDGTVSLVGGTLQTAGNLLNDTGGVISGRGTLIVGGTLENHGRLQFGAGFSDIYGDLSNVAGSSIIASGGATVVFYDDVVHNGAEIRLGAGSSAVYFGEVSGTGPFTGLGTSYFEGGINPGNSPGVLTVAGDATLSTSNTLTIELADGAHDMLDVGGALGLGGVLNIMLLDAFIPVAGMNWEIVRAQGGLSGAFDSIVLPQLVGLRFVLDQQADRIVLSAATAVPLPAGIWAMLGGLGVLSARRRVALPCVRAS